MKRNQKIPLLGTDHFMLALEANDTSIGTSGNSCRYILELDGEFNSERFKKLLQENELARWLTRFSLPKKMVHTKNWTEGKENLIQVSTIHSDELVPKEIIAAPIPKENAPLFYFHYVIGKNVNRLIFSWHHLLMDAYGATLFLKNLETPIKVQTTNQEKSPFSLTVFKQLFQAKRFIDKTSTGDIETIESSFSETVKQNYKVLSFSKNETQIIENKSINNGSKFGPSSYFLACSAKIVADKIEQSGKLPKDFWIPVPQNSRKRGAKWPVIGNHLSFLFYRIKKEYYKDKKALTVVINEQMMQQIRAKNPQAYAHLLNYLRHIPTWIYAKLIKGPNGKSLSSFLFTVAGEHPKNFQSLNGCKIKNALSIPPNTYPPGLTFAFTRFEDCIQIAIPYYEHLFNEEEIQDLLTDLRKELLT
ncbi:MAG TPA: hypothetical protein EYG86_03730 [Crocinitomicaceae bacterium]|nr:hypothetical protein [Crocinitomicaceae bacterium]